MTTALPPEVSDRIDTLSITWTIDIGPGARPDELGQVLFDLEHALSLGERWGIVRAQMYEADGLIPGGSLGHGVHLPIYSLGQQVAYEAFHDALQLDVDAEARQPEPPAGDPPPLAALGSRVLMGHATYRNPLVVDLLAQVGGGGALVWGTIKVLSMIRDWGPKRRRDTAKAVEAEANARIRLAAADIAAWIATQTAAGMQPLPVSVMIAAVGLADLQALDRLSQRETTLEVPDDLAALDA